MQPTDAGQVHAALLAALDECALALKCTEALAQLGRTSPEQTQTALLAILVCAQEARANVLDICEGMEALQ